MLMILTQFLRNPSASEDHLFCANACIHYYLPLHEVDVAGNVLKFVTVSVCLYVCLSVCLSVWTVRVCSDGMLRRLLGTPVMLRITLFLLLLTHMYCES